jgi:hypothetical protein
MMYVHVPYFSSREVATRFGLVFVLQFCLVFSKILKMAKKPQGTIMRHCPIAYYLTLPCRRTYFDYDGTEYCIIIIDVTDTV